MAGEWVKSNKRYIQPFPTSVLNGQIENTSWIEKMVRSRRVGIVDEPGTGGTLTSFVFLYRIQNTNGTFVQTYYFRKFYGSQNGSQGVPLFVQYNSSKYGTKDFSEVINVQGPQTGGSTTTQISTSTSTTYSSVLTPDYLSAGTTTTELNRIALQPINREMQEFQSRITADLEKRGYSSLEIRAYLRARDDKERGFVKKVAEARIASVLNKLFGNKSTGGSGGSSGGSGSSSTNPGANFVPISTPEVQTRLVVRMPSGYVVPSQQQLASITMPGLNQVFIGENGRVQSYTYIFDHIPSNIQYSNLGSEWVEIPRAENFPFVDWSRYKLMRISMSWVISTDRVESGGAVVNDGLFRSVDSNIISLRRMAQRKHPVTIVNMDDLLSVQLKVDEQNGSIRSVRGMQFVITDLSITAVRRTSDPTTGQPTSPSKISVAQCQMTLQEIPIETIKIVSFPTLNIPFTAPRQSPQSNPLQNTSPINLASSNFLPQPNRSFIVQQGDGT